MELCGSKSRVYTARDVCGYFDDPFDSKIRASAKTGEERAKAFRKPLSELEQLVRYKRDHDALERKRERERQAAEAAKVVDRRESVAVQGAVAKVAAGPSDAHVDLFELLRRKRREEAERVAGRRESAAVHGAAARMAPRPSGGNVDSLKGDHDDQEGGQDHRARIASEFVDLCGHDVRQAVAWLIEHRWNKADALEWLTAWVSNKRSAAKPPDGPWPPVIVCGEVPPWEKAKAGQYVTWGPSRVMVIDSVAESEIVLEDPFDQWSKYPIFVTRDEWDHVLATTEEHVKSEFARLEQDIPTGQPKKNRGRQETDRAEEARR